MRTIVGGLSVAALLTFALLAGTGSAQSACGAVCHAKCEATAALAGQTVAECVKEWSYINANYKKNPLVACNSVCRAKCNYEPSCIAKWAPINAHATGLDKKK